VQAAMKDKPQIKAILFDADGVLQRPSVWWREALMPILGAVDIAEVDPFLRDILETELAHLCAPSGFDSALMETLSRWNRSERFADTAHALNAIRPYDDVIAVVRLLRHAGMPCHIASNQQAGRARYMSEGLGYKALFVEEFYSCRLGFAKNQTLRSLGVYLRCWISHRSASYLSTIDRKTWMLRSEPAWPPPCTTVKVAPRYCERSWRSME
jgi:phosphoglycolate phosphatase-like HAD superfamily hydrolase